MDSQKPPVEGKCRQCDECRGEGCTGELPGMGGVLGSSIFRLNASDWDRFGAGSGQLPAIRLAPMTGAVQNMGFPGERDWYEAAAEGCVRAGVRLSIGDGFPDEKLKFGIEALRSRGLSGAVVIKPYGNEKIIERAEWAEGVAEFVGVDIDSWAILTMRDFVTLYRKSASDLLEVKRAVKAPFLVKGVFLPEDLELVRAVRPDVAIVSNHGGRIDTEVRSTASYLAEYGKALRRFAGEVWVDGGVRKRRDLEVAAALGAKEVLVGRPFVSAVLRRGPAGIAEALEARYGLAARPDGRVPDRRPAGWNPPPLTLE